MNRLGYRPVQNVLQGDKMCRYPIQPWVRGVFSKNVVRTKGAPRNATSNGTLLSLPRHWTQGSLANVVMPEKMESAVTA